MKRIILIACCCLAIGLVASQAYAVNSVVVESRNFAASAAACSVGVFITNDVEITGITMPLEIRSTNGGAYFTGNLVATLFSLQAGRRMQHSPLGPAYDNSIDSVWPAASQTLARFDTVSTGTECSGPTSHSWSGAAGTTVPASSPDAVFLALVSQGDPGVGELITLAPGADPARRDSASIIFRFNVNASNGCFEIDTCCRTPASHLVYVDANTQAVQPEFTKGEISIGTGTCGGPPPNTPPIAICKDVHVAANGSCQGTVTPAQLDNGSHDAEDGLSINFSMLEAPPFSLGPHVVHLVVTDSQGAKDTCQSTVTVDDSTKPVLTCPSAINQANDPGTCTAVVSFPTPVATDNCDQSLTFTFTPPSGSTFSKGTTPVKVVVNDDAGNKDSCNFNVNVNDTTKPTISCPGGINVQCIENVPAPYPTAQDFLNAGGTYSDNCAGNWTWSYGGQQVSANGCPRTIDRTYKITDESGNFQTCIQTITVQDTTKPVFTFCHADTTVMIANNLTSAVVNFTPGTASDNCAGVVGIVANPLSGSTFNLGTTPVTVTATDSCGNQQTCHFNVEVDTIPTTKVPPVAICKNIDVNADGNCQGTGSVDNGSHDPDGGAVLLHQVPPGPYGLGSNNVTLWVIDDEGDSTSCNATVTVHDVTPPVASCPVIDTVSNDLDSCGAVVDWSNDISGPDNCGPTVSVYTPPSGSFFPVGTTQVMHVLTDQSGNADTCYFNVTVKDTQKPTLTCNPIILSNDSNACEGTICTSDIVASINYSDNCGVVAWHSTIFLSAKSASLAEGDQCQPIPIGEWQIATQVFDNAGNVSDTCWSTVTVKDTQKPTIVCPGNIVVEAPQGAGGMNVNFNAPNVSDNCPGVDFSCGATSGDFFPLGVTTVCCHAFDAAQNTDSCCFTITVNPPAVGAPGPRAEPDTLIAKLICGQCDTFAVHIDYLIPPPNKGGSFPWEFTENLPWLTVSGFDGFAPEDISLIVCPGDLPPGEYSGWFYMSPILTKGTTAPPTDSIFVIMEANPSFPSLDIPQDSVHIYYTGGVNDTLCGFFNIINLTCGQACWSYFPLDPPKWLSLSKTEGETPDSVEVCVNPCGLEEGIYCVPITICPCPSAKSDKNIGCDFVWIDLHVINPPAMVVNPTNANFPCVTYGDTVAPIEIAISNAGGGDLSWASWHTQPWLHVEPDYGAAPSNMILSINWDSLAQPQHCDTLYDTVHVEGNKGCAFFGDQLIEVTLCVCPGEQPLCDSICGYVYDAECAQKSICAVDSANVELWSSYPDGVILSSTMAPGGLFCFEVTPGQEYDIRVWKKGYCTQVVENWKCEDGFLNIGLDPLDFVPLPNWPYFTDYFSTDAEFKSGGVFYPILPGDVIYATDPQGVICGIAWVTQAGTYLIHVLGDDPKTGVDEGAIQGDQITLWLNCKCPAVAPDTWVNFGDFQFDARWDCETKPLCCTLCQGWNMWSYNRILTDSSRTSVLTTIDLNYDAVRSGLCDYGSISWFEGRPVNDLVNVPANFGYDIHMKADDTVCVDGPVIPPSTPIYLCAGWNYIPYWPEDMDNLSHALQSLSGNYSHIFTMYCGIGVISWDETRPPQNNDLVCMETCHGYWIKMKSDDTLIYPSTGYECGAAAPKMSVFSSSGRVAISPEVADFWSAASAELHAGDMLTVRGESGQMVGEATVGAGGSFLIHVYGDVANTPEIEGVQPGEKLTFEVNGVAASVVGQSQWYDRDNSQIVVTPASSSPVPTEYALLQNYPNPFNAGTVMPFVLKTNSSWTLTVYNVMGQEVRSFTGNDGAGVVRVSWNGTDRNGATIPSGIYFYRVSTPEWTASKKMTLLK